MCQCYFALNRSRSSEAGILREWIYDGYMRLAARYMYPSGTIHAPYGAIYNRYTVVKEKSESRSLKPAKSST
jgi:hypothetical protein